jgi:hypothetical protein
VPPVNRPEAAQPSPAAPADIASPGTSESDPLPSSSPDPTADSGSATSDDRLHDGTVTLTSRAAVDLDTAQPRWSTASWDRRAASISTTTATPQPFGATAAPSSCSRPAERRYHLWHCGDRIVVLLRDIRRAPGVGQHPGRGSDRITCCPEGAGVVHHCRGCALEFARWTRYSRNLANVLQLGHLCILAADRRAAARTHPRPAPGPPPHPTPQSRAGGVRQIGREGPADQALSPSPS